MNGGFCKGIIHVAKPNWLTQHQVNLSTNHINNASKRVDLHPTGKCCSLGHVEDIEEATNDPRCLTGENCFAFMTSIILKKKKKIQSLQYACKAGCIDMVMHLLMLYNWLSEAIWYVSWYKWTAACYILQYIYLHFLLVRETKYKLGGTK